ncbi:hypothetical protein DIPPA_52568 [Diplonema papillatum]|nr:hypothetical protein DIPPA_52568 [Diplonema papillatum]
MSDPVGALLPGARNALLERSCQRSLLFDTLQGYIQDIEAHVAESYVCYNELLLTEAKHAADLRVQDAILRDTAALLDLLDRAAAMPQLEQRSG